MAPESTRLETPVASTASADVFAWGDGRMLKLFRPAWGVAAANRERHAIDLAHAAGVGAPEVFEAVTVDGRAGLVVERLEGPTMLEALVAHPERGGDLGAALADLHARIHAAPAPGLPSLRDALRARIARARALPAMARQAVLGMLATLPEVGVLCHGDLHPGNVILTPGGPRPVDWFDAALGHPLADVARTTMVVEHAAALGTAEGDAAGALDAVRTTVLDAYLDRYAALRPFEPEALDAWRLPIAVARLAERIPATEARALERFVAARLAG